MAAAPAADQEIVLAEVIESTMKSGDSAQWLPLARALLAAGYNLVCDAKEKINR